MLGNIRNLEHFSEQIADWSFLNGVFSNPKIKVGDADGMTERAGNLLILEKKSHDAVLNTGQRVMYENLQKVGSATTMVIWYEANEPTYMKVFHANGETRSYVVDEDEVRKHVRRWEDWAKSHPKL